MESKTCTQCGETKPIAGFHTNRTRPDGYAASCRPCARTPRRIRPERMACSACGRIKSTATEFPTRGNRCRVCATKASYKYASKRAKLCIVKTEGVKHCPKCDTTQPVVNFRKDKTRKDGRQCWCNGCQLVKRKIWESRNKEHILSYQRELSRKHRLRANAGGGAPTVAMPDHREWEEAARTLERAGVSAVQTALWKAHMQGVWVGWDRGTNSILTQACLETQGMSWPDVCAKWDKEVKKEWPEEDAA